MKSIKSSPCFLQRGDKLLGNDNELSASDLMSVSELSVAVSPKVIIIKKLLN